MCGGSRVNSVFKAFAIVYWRWEELPAPYLSHSGLAGVMVYTIAEFSAAVLHFFDSLPHMPS